MPERKTRIAITLLFIFLITLSKNNICLPQPPTSQIERAQELLEKEKALRERLQSEEKVFIKKITLKGVTLLSDEQVKEIVLPFQNQWVPKEDIKHIVNLIIQAYVEKGIDKSRIDISYQIKKKHLIIQVNEDAQNEK